MYFQSLSVAKSLLVRGKDGTFYSLCERGCCHGAAELGSGGEQEPCPRFTLSPRPWQGPQRTPQRTPQLLWLLGLVGSVLPVLHYDDNRGSSQFTASVISLPGGSMGHLVGSPHVGFWGEGGILLPSGPPAMRPGPLAVSQRSRGGSGNTSSFGLHQIYQCPVGRRESCGTAQGVGSKAPREHCRREQKVARA